MKKDLKEFCSRGLIAMGFGPLVYGVVMLILYLCNVDTTMDGLVVFKGIISISILAFVIAGITIIWQKEEIQLVKKISIHFFVLYLLYLVVYLLNDWIEKDFQIIGIFTLIFILGYILIWIIIYFSEKKRAKKLNEYIK